MTLSDLFLQARGNGLLQNCGYYETEMRERIFSRLGVIEILKTTKRSVCSPHSRSFNQSSRPSRSRRAVSVSISTLPRGRDLQLVSGTSPKS